MSDSNRCSVCGALLVQNDCKEGSGHVIRARILKLRPGGEVLGPCPKCRAMVRLPLSHSTGSTQGT